MKMILAVVVGLCGAMPAFAQYYERPRYDGPPPGYYPERPYREPRYRVPFGRRCDAMLDTPYGPRQLICPIVEAKPLGEPCACPPPRPPPGYRPGPFVSGTTIR